MPAGTPKHRTPAQRQGDGRTSKVKSRAHRTADRFPKLAKLLADNRTLLIVMQDNPDPDAIASAVALRGIARKAGVRCTIVHGGPSAGARTERWCST